jgi:hypothetical protein
MYPRMEFNVNRTVACEHIRPFKSYVDELPTIPYFGDGDKV